MNPKQIIDAVRDYMDVEDLRYKVDFEHKPHPLLVTGFELREGTPDVKMIIDARETGYMVLAIPEMRFSAQHIGELQEYVTRANWNFLSGSFDLDVHDGDVRFRYFVDCDGLRMLPMAIIERSIHLPVCIIDRFGAGLCAVTEGIVDARTAIARVGHPDA